MIPGTIAWCDLTTPNADSVRDFYAHVAGWTPRAEAMEGYSDYSMLPAGGNDPVAGICHARGPNADLPAQWLVYIVVEDVDSSAARCVERGGEVVAGPRPMAGGRFAVIRDPAGAVCALFTPPAA
jgi:predicted enzyme related to lactoylglutathione lyase